MKYSELSLELETRVSNASRLGKRLSQCKNEAEIEALKLLDFNQEKNERYPHLESETNRLIKLRGRLLTELAGKTSEEMENIRHKAEYEDLDDEQLNELVKLKKEQEEELLAKPEESERINKDPKYKALLMKNTERIDPLSEWLFRIKKDVGQYKDTMPRIVDEINQVASNLREQTLSDDEKNNYLVSLQLLVRIVCSDVDISASAQSMSQGTGEAALINQGGDIWLKLVDKLNLFEQTKNTIAELKATKKLDLEAIEFCEDQLKEFKKNVTRSLNNNSDDVDKYLTSRLDAIKKSTDNTDVRIEALSSIEEGIEKIGLLLNQEGQFDKILKKMVEYRKQLQSGNFQQNAAQSKSKKNMLATKLSNAAVWMSKKSGIRNRMTDFNNISKKGDSKEDQIKKFTLLCTMLRGDFKNHSHQSLMSQKKFYNFYLPLLQKLEKKYKEMEIGCTQEQREVLIEQMAWMQASLVSKLGPQLRKQYIKEMLETADGAQIYQKMNYSAWILTHANKLPSQTQKQFYEEQITLITEIRDLMAPYFDRLTPEQQAHIETHYQNAVGALFEKTTDPLLLNEILDTKLNALLNNDGALLFRLLDHQMDINIDKKAGEIARLQSGGKNSAKKIAKLDREADKEQIKVVRTIAMRSLQSPLDQKLTLEQKLQIYVRARTYLSEHERNDFYQVFMRVKNKTDTMEFLRKEKKAISDEIQELELPSTANKSEKEIDALKKEYLAKYLKIKGRIQQLEALTADLENQAKKANQADREFQQYIENYIKENFSMAPSVHEEKREQFYRNPLTIEQNAMFDAAYESLSESALLLNDKLYEPMRSQLAMTFFRENKIDLKDFAFRYPGLVTEVFEATPDFVTQTDLIFIANQEYGFDKLMYALTKTAALKEDFHFNVKLWDRLLNGDGSAQQKQEGRNAVEGFIAKMRLNMFADLKNQVGVHEAEMSPDTKDNVLRIEKIESMVKEIEELKARVNETTSRLQLRELHAELGEKYATLNQSIYDFHTVLKQKITLDPAVIESIENKEKQIASLTKHRDYLVMHGDRIISKTKHTNLDPNLLSSLVIVTAERSHEHRASEKSKSIADIEAPDLEETVTDSKQPSNRLRRVTTRLALLGKKSSVQRRTSQHAEEPTEAVSLSADRLQGDTSDEQIIAADRASLATTQSLSELEKSEQAEQVELINRVNNPEILFNLMCDYTEGKPPNVEKSHDKAIECLKRILQSPAYNDKIDNRFNEKVTAYVVHHSFLIAVLRDSIPSTPSSGAHVRNYNEETHHETPWTKRHRNAELIETGKTGMTAGYRETRKESPPTTPLEGTNLPKRDDPPLPSQTPLKKMRDDPPIPSHSTGRRR